MSSVEELNERIAELEERLAQFEAKTGFMSAETMVERAEAWVKRNPKAWGIIRSHAESAARNQHSFSIKKELENLRSLHIAWVYEDDYKISNSYSPVFVRMLIREIPGLRGCVTIKRSKVDRFFRDVA